MSKIGAREYIDSLRAKCDFEGMERVRHSEPVRHSDDYLKSIGITPCNDMSFTDILNAKTDILVKRIADALRRLDLTMTKVPQIALLPTEDFNAWATVAPNGDPICILDPGLSASLLHFSWSLAEATIQPPGSTVEPDHVKCCFGAIAACEEIVYGGHEPARQYLRSADFRGDESWFMFGVFFARAIESFILSHEFAHHIRGHVNLLRKDVLQRHSIQQSINVYNRSQLEEFEADRIGADIFLAIEPEMYSPHFMCGPLVFFDLLSFAEKFIIKNPSSLTHPAAEERKIRLEAYLWNKLPSEARDYYKVTPSFWKLVERTKELFTHNP